MNKGTNLLKLKLNFFYVRASLSSHKLYPIARDSPPFRTYFFRFRQINIRIFGCEPELLQLLSGSETVAMIEDRKNRKGLLRAEMELIRNYNLAMQNISNLTNFYNNLIRLHVTITRIQKQE